MATLGGRRVIVAIQPVVLEGAFATILGGSGDVVVQYRAAQPAERRAHYDAAIVSTDLTADVSADVVITLPDTSTVPRGPLGPHQGRLTTSDRSYHVTIRDQRDVINLLEQHVPLRA